MRWGEANYPFILSNKWSEYAGLKSSKFGAALWLRRKSFPADAKRFLAERNAERSYVDAEPELALDPPDFLTTDIKKRPRTRKR
jgi:hypothetical protein